MIVPARENNRHSLSCAYRKLALSVHFVVPQKDAMGGPRLHLAVIKAVGDVQFTINIVTINSRRGAEPLYLDTADVQTYRQAKSNI